MARSWPPAATTTTFDCGTSRTANLRSHSKLMMPWQASLRISFFPDGQKIASGGWAGDGTARIFDLKGKQLQLVGDDKLGGLPVLTVSPTGKYLAWGNGGKIHLFDVTLGREACLLRVNSAVDSVAFSPDGTLLATPFDGIVRLWEVDSGKTIRDLSSSGCSATGCQAVTFSPDGKTIAVGESQGRTLGCRHGETQGDSWPC